MGFFETDSGCGNCNLSEGCTSPRLSTIGAGEKKILILVDHPTVAEDTAGSLAFGKSDLLYAMQLKSLGISPDTDCWKVAAVRCRPNKKKITAGVVTACRKHLHATIKKLKPERILVFGKTALDVLIGDRVSATAYLKYVGRIIPDAELNTVIAPLYSPAYLRVNCKAFELSEPLWRVNVEQIQNAIEGKPEPRPKFKGYYNAPDNLKNITTGTWAFDIETTGLKPYAEGHKIICLAFSDGKNNLCVEYSDQIKPELERIFTAPEIRLVAHNLKFEDLWIREILGIQITNWYWDTMLAEHTIDNSSGITGLKFITYTRYGVAGYEADVKPFLSSDDPSGIAINKIEDAPREPLMRYCAQDAFYTAHIFKGQFPKVPKGFFLFLEGAKELSRVESNGFRVDIERIKQKREMLRKEAATLSAQIAAHPAVIAWKNANEKDFNPGSSLQLRSFFLSVGSGLWKKTAKGNESVDKEVLQSLDHPVADLILQLRAAQKLEGTFLSGFEDETVGDILHPTFSLNVARTFRSSSSNPNMQNISKRNKRAMRLLRGNFIPRDGNILVEVDYSGVEVRVAACYNKDPQMIAYIQDPSTDMHRDVAAQIIGIPTDKVKKGWRQWAKGGFVFPAFYGSWYKQISENMWRDAEPDLRKELSRSGIHTEKAFEKRIQEIEKHFWEVRFKQYGKWKRAQWKKYLDKGYIQSLTGFRYTGVMNRKEVSNYPIQGSAFHCLLFSLIGVNRFLRDTGKQSMIIGQIHDSLILDIVPAERDEIFSAIRRITCEDIREHWKWINVPLDIDAEESPVNWYEMREVKI